jgi:hypothetical protein
MTDVSVSRTTRGSWSPPALPMMIPRVHVPSEDLRWLRGSYSVFFVLSFPFPHRIPVHFFTDVQSHCVSWYWLTPVLFQFNIFVQKRHYSMPPSSSDTVGNTPLLPKISQSSRMTLLMIPLHSRFGSFCVPK